MKNQVKVVGIIEKLSKAIQESLKGKIKSTDILERHSSETELKELDDKKMSALIYLSTRQLDNDGDIVTPDGWDLSVYRKNPVGLWSHQWQMPAIYKATDTQADAYGLMQHILFEPSERGQDFFNLVKGGFLSTFSAGFRADRSIHRGEPEFQKQVERYRQDWPEFAETETGVERIIVEKLLFESSLCNVPSNASALVIAVGDGKMNLSDATKKELRMDDIIRKCVDTGEVDKKYAKGPAPKPAAKDPEQKAEMKPPYWQCTECENKQKEKPPCSKCGSEKMKEVPEPVKRTSIVLVPVVKLAAMIRPVITPEEIGRIVEEQVGVVIAKKRGMVL
jgi:phage head maturation protease